MTAYELSEHARDMLRERGIPEEWLRLALDDPDRTEAMDDGTFHYLKAIEAFGGRYLRVVVNPLVSPQRVVTLFFDRRLGRIP